MNEYIVKILIREFLEKLTRQRFFFLVSTSKIGHLEMFNAQYFIYKHRWTPSLVFNISK